MKRSFRIFAISALLFATPVFAAACDIFVSVDGVKKQKYLSGDILVIKIEVKLIHRNCAVDIDETDIKVAGMEIIGATKWVNTEGTKWERKIKVRISPGDQQGKATLVAERSCQKEGGRGSLTLST